MVNPRRGSRDASGAMEEAGPPPVAPRVVAHSDPGVRSHQDLLVTDEDRPGDLAALVVVRAVVDLAAAGVPNDAVLEVRLVNSTPHQIEGDAVIVLIASQAEGLQRLDDLEVKGPDANVIDSRTQAP